MTDDKRTQPRPMSLGTEKTVTMPGGFGPDGKPRPVPAPAPDLEPAQLFGDYEILAEVARGGMGVVYQARQTKLNRIVALKMVLAGRLADPDDLQRFRTEAEAAARLQHPNIVTVHEVGTVDGQQFFSMEYIQGTSLARRLVDGPLPSRVAARLLHKLAKAMHYAHKQGILHRDLKPSNIMIDAEDEPHITDFGLAKRLDNDTGNTRTGAVLGTPSYMAPEQAAGKARELGPACDVYGLGALLYETLTGRPPFKAETSFDTVLQVMHNVPVPLRLLNDEIDHDLETICLKCLEKDPRDRYASAQALAQDLQRYLDGESISARSFNIFDRLTRVLERSQHDVAFHAWSSMLLIMAMVIFVEHLVVFLLLEFQQSPKLVFAARSTQFVILVALFWRNRGKQLLPTTAAERELWTIWIGFFLAYGASLWVIRLLFLEGILESSPEHRLEDLLPYPIFSILSGLAFFIMGCNYWGRCYAFGIAFIGVGLLMPGHLSWAPLEFGLLWTIALTSLGLRLRRLARQAHSDADSAADAEKSRASDPAIS